MFPHDIIFINLNLLKLILRKIFSKHLRHNKNIIYIQRAFFSSGVG